MLNENSLIVHVAGRQLDVLREEATRLAKANKGEWWIERAKVGSRFWFEKEKAVEDFVRICEAFGLFCRKG